MSERELSYEAQERAQQANTVIEHRARLDIDCPPLNTRQTSIICTIGPSTSSVEKITELRRAGMNIVRLNFSHGSHDYHAATIKAVRESVEQTPEAGRVIGIALDTKGPEIRTGVLKSGSEVQLKEGALVTVSVDPVHLNECDETLIHVDYKNLPQDMKPGSIIFIDDGLIQLRVLTTAETSLEAEVLNSGLLGSRKGVNLPEVKVQLPALSEKDRSDLQFAIDQGLDMIFASFIRKASDVLEVRECLGEAGKRIRIISKIENHEGMSNFDEILAVTDGVMVARGDLGIEIPPEKVFVAQKMIMSKCNLAGKPVICATQMLESMIKNPRPTRAEVSDVANAVLDGADCVMLSGETAKGDYPIEAVRIMSNICQEAESASFRKLLVSELMRSSVGHMSLSEPVAISIVTAASSNNCKAILCMTSTGDSPRLIAKYRPRCPILVISRDAQTLRQIHLSRGCFPLYCTLDRVDDRDEDVRLRLQFGLEEGKRLGFFSDGDPVILTSGSRPGPHHRSLTDFRILIVGE